MAVRPAGVAPDVTIVIPVFNQLELTRACVASIHARGAACSFEIVVVDNGSDDGTDAWLADAAAAGRLRAVAAGGNLGFSRGCNLGARHARGRCLLFLNNDMEVLPGWLEPLVDTLDNDPDVGVVGARLLFPDGTIQHAGVAVVDYRDEDPPLLGGQHKSYRLPHDDPEVLRPQLLQVVTGACLAIRPELFAALGGFDEGYWNGNEDVDLCLRAGEAGWLVAYRPESTVIHYESQSGPERWARVQPNVARFNAAWRGRARPDFVNRDGAFHETADSAIRLHTPPGQLYAARRRPWPARPEVTVVVVPRGDAAGARRALAALLEHTDPRHRLLLVDDGERPDAVAAWHETVSPRGRTGVVPGRGNAGVNAALAAADGDAMCLLAADAVVTADWLETLLAGLGAHAGVGLAGPATGAAAVGQRVPVPFDPAAPAPDTRVLAAFAAERARRHAGATSAASQLAGFCLLMRRTLVERVGGLDVTLAGLDGAAIDLCLRATLAGFRAAVMPAAFVHLPASTEDPAAGADSARLCAKWPLAGRDDSALRTLLARGFLPPLHFEPLPAGPTLTAVPVPAWAARRWIEAGEESFAGGRCAEAVRLFRAAAAALPDDPRAANDLAVALLHLDPDGRGRELARAILRGVLARDPANADAAWNLRELDAVAAG